MKQSSIRLFDSIVKNFSEITILFNNTLIKENLVYIKGCFINNGDIDIDGKRIEKPINVSLPQNYNWVSCKITNTSYDFVCEYNLKDSKNLQFDFGLFRKNEFYQIEALIEATQDKDKNASIFDELKFTHRISQVQKITVTNLLSEKEIKKRKGGIKRNLLMSALQLFVPFVVSIIFFTFVKSADLYYKETINGSITEYKASAKRDGTIVLKNATTNQEKTISIIDFQNKSKYIPYIPERTIWQKIFENWYIWILLLFFLLIIVGSDYWELMESNKIYRILKTEEQD